MYLSDHRNSLWRHGGLTSKRSRTDLGFNCRYLPRPNVHHETTANTIMVAPRCHFKASQPYTSINLKVFFSRLQTCARFISVGYFNIYELCSLPLVVFVMQLQLLAHLLVNYWDILCSINWGKLFWFVWAEWPFNVLCVWNLNLEEIQQYLLCSYCEKWLVWFVWVKSWAYDMKTLTLPGEPYSELLSVW